MNIAGLNKAAVLAALYNNARVQGLGFLQASNKPMQESEAAKILKEQTYFDYLKGRVMKINLANDEVNTWLYNRDNGEGEAERVIEELRSKQPEPKA